MTMASSIELLVESEIAKTSFPLVLTVSRFKKNSKYYPSSRQKESMMPEFDPNAMRGIDLM